MNAKINKEATRLGLGIRPDGHYVRGGWTDGSPGKWVFSTYPLSDPNHVESEDMGGCVDTTEEVIELLKRDAEYFENAPAEAGSASPPASGSPRLRISNKPITK